MPQQFDSLSAGATLSGARALASCGRLSGVTQAISSGSGPDGRPLRSTGSRTINVSGDLQSALESDLPWLLDHAITFDLGGGSVGETRVPPFIATWSPQGINSNHPLLIQNGTIDAMTVGGGVGAFQCRNVTFTGTSSFDNEGCAVSNYNTYRLALNNCTINASQNGIISYNGQVHANNTEINAPGSWGVKVKNWGRYWETGGGVTGGNSYDVDAGFINMNPPNGSSLSGGVNANAPSDGGFVLDDTNGTLWGPDSIVMADQTSGDLYEFTVSGGSPSASRW